MVLMSLRSQLQRFLLFIVTGSANSRLMMRQDTMADRKQRERKKTLSQGHALSDLVSSYGLHFLKFPEPSKIVPPTEDKCFKTIAFGGVGGLTVYLSHSRRPVDWVSPHKQTC